MQTSIKKQDSNGQQVKETQRAILTDSVGVLKNNAAYCGRYEYTIGSITKSAAAEKALGWSNVDIDRNSGWIKVYTGDWTHIGFHQVTVIASLFINFGTTMKVE